MKQKYLIINDKTNRQFKIQEYAELNKEMLSLLCEEVYDYKTIKAAVSSGKDELISALKTNNLYPPGIYAEKIAAAVLELHKSKNKESVELFFDDINLLTKTRKSAEIDQPFEDDNTDLDEILEDNVDETFQDKEALKKIDSSLKVEDDDYGDIDNGS